MMCKTINLHSFLCDETPERIAPLCLEYIDNAEITVNRKPKLSRDEPGKHWHNHRPMFYNCSHGNKP